MSHHTLSQVHQERTPGVQPVQCDTTARKKERRWRRKSDGERRIAAERAGGCFGGLTKLYSHRSGQWWKPQSAREERETGRKRRESMMAPSIVCRLSRGLRRGRTVREHGVRRSVECITHERRERRGAIRLLVAEKRGLSLPSRRLFLAPFDPQVIPDVHTTKRKASESIPTVEGGRTISS